MKRPILSIAVPSYNVETYINKCLDSMLKAGQQGSLEVIVINDGSTDGTLEIASSYLLRYPHIYKVISQDNGGHGSGIMTGISNATGKYFMIIDADDWADPDALTKHIENLSTCASDIVITPFTLVDLKSGKKKNKALPSRVEERSEQCVADTPELYHFYDIHCLTVNTELLRRINIRLPLKTYYEDSEYVFKIVTTAETVTCFSENVYQYLVGNISQSMNALKMVERYQQHDLILRRMAEASASVTDSKKLLCFERIRTIALKQLIIAFIYDGNPGRGRPRAYETMKMLHTSCPDVAIKLRGNYRVLKLLNYVGVKASIWEYLKNIYQEIVKR